VFATDQETYESLNALSRIAQEGNRSLIVWIGAGASTWAGYPLWQDTAASMHTMFSREEKAYDKQRATDLLAHAEYPALFEKMRLANQPRYFAVLTQTFSPKPSRGVYLRLLRALQRITPTRIVTTNVDETLEHNLPTLETVQRSDIERVHRLLGERTGFVCKLHGSVSSVESIVFSTRDYDDLRTNDLYLSTLRAMLSDTVVLFLGYGLRDQYVIECLQTSAAGRPLFGTGPHFIVAAEDAERPELPSCVRRIRYVADPTDHRSALLALEAFADSASTPVIDTPRSPAVPPPEHRSLYFISDLLPPGKWTTSQTVTIESISGGKPRQMIVGEGYVDGEVEIRNYSALHDVVVGLICFDTICLAIYHLGALHQLLGSESFWLVAKTGAIRLVIPPMEPAVIFDDEHTLVGDLGAITLGSKASSPESFVERTTSEQIRSQIAPAPGREREAEALFQFLESSTIEAAGAALSDRLPERTRSALMHPSIRRLLGISGGAPRNAVPRWVAFPILRLAGVIRRGLICEHIRACATRMIWGSEKLATAAFCASAGTEWADGAARYALTGRFNSDVGALVAVQPDVLHAVLRFRESSVGMGFRREILESLAINDGGQVVTAINAGLRQALPLSLLDQARDHLSGLFVPKEAAPRLVPAVWGDLRNADERIAGWRKRSQVLLDEACRSRRLGPYDPCPCGSGEKLKFCCYAALH